MKECRQIRKQFDERLDGRLGFAHEQGFDEHLALCPACRQRWQQYVDVWRTVGHLNPVEPSIGFVERTMRRLEEPPVSQQTPWKWLVLRWGTLTCVVAALAVGGWISWQRAQLSRSAVIYASLQEADYLEDFDVIASLDELEGDETTL